MMKSVALVFLGVLAFSARADAQVRVRGYVRKDGTYVAPHVRSAPDSTTTNNWGTRGNVNPYTREAGRKDALPSAPAGTATPGTSSRPAGTAAIAPAVPPSAPPPGAALGMSSQQQGPRKVASVTPPGALTKRGAWALSFTPPAGSLTEELRLAGVTGVACAKRPYPDCPCRPVVAEYPAGPGEILLDRAAFFAAINQVSERLDIWAFPSPSECKADQGYVQVMMKDDYSPPTGCLVIKFQEGVPVIVVAPAGPSMP